MTDHPINQLEILRKKRRKARIGFRREEYQIMQDTMRVGMTLRSKHEALEQFVKRNGINPVKLRKADRNWIATAVFTFVDQCEKQGFKEARVASFLVDKKGVAID